MTKDELDEVLEKHRKWLNDEDGGQRANLSRADLSRADLHGADLCRAELCRADLRGADLCGAYLRTANLRGADLCGANLLSADLRSANLRGANLLSANLSRADLRGADLRSANLHGADLSRADLDFSCWPLWCGSLDVKVDARIAAQLVYHAVRACQSVEDDEGVAAFCRCPDVVALANRFHLADECGRIDAK